MKKTLILALFTLLLVACQDLNPALPDQASTPTSTNEKMAAGQTFELPEGTFAQKGNEFEGEVFVRGYAKTTPVDEAFCSEDCKKYNLVTFNVTNSNNDALTQFMDQGTGEAFIFNLGCLNSEGKIFYSNESVETGMEDYELNESLSQSIMASTPEAPIILKLTRMPAAGMDATTCYSHFMGVDQLMI